MNMNYLHTIIDTSGALPIDIHAHHGESVLLNVELRNYGEPIITAEQLTCKTYYQELDTASPNEWYESDDAVILREDDGTAVEFFWSDKLDGGADAYRYFIRLENGDSISYAIRGNIYLAASPGFTPNEIELPVKVLDFSSVQVVNAPYYSKGEIDTELEAIDKSLDDHAKAIEDLRDEIKGDAEETLKEHEENYDNPHQVTAAQLATNDGNGSCSVSWNSSGQFQQGYVNHSFDPAMFRAGNISGEFTIPDYVTLNGVSLGGQKVSFSNSFTLATEGNWSGWIFVSTTTQLINGLNCYIFISVDAGALMREDTSSTALWIGLGLTQDPGDYSNSCEVLTGTFDPGTSSYVYISSHSYAMGGTYHLLSEKLLRDKSTGKAYTLAVDNGQLKLVQYREGTAN